MKCSLKGGFISIFLIAFIAPSDGVEYSILLRRSSVPGKPMYFRQFRTRLQDLDSFPDDGGSQNQLHKIVKKQMAISDYNDLRKSKRSLKYSQSSFEGGDSGSECKGDGSVKRAVGSNSESRERYYRGRVSNTPLTKTRNFFKKLTDVAPGRAPIGSTSGLSKTYVKVPDGNSRWSYCECEVPPDGCVKLRRRWCPRRHFKCLDLGGTSLKRFRKARGNASGQRSSFDTPEDSEPANEWLDASKGVAQKIPSEFKPKKKPVLKIYHLRVKRKFDGALQNRIMGHRALGTRRGESHVKLTIADGDKIKKRGGRRHVPRSFVIRINKKEWKDSNDEKLADKDENDSDEEDEESEDEEDDEDAEDEDDAEEDEDDKETSTRSYNSRDSFKDLLRSAKAAMANRAKFAEAGDLSEISEKTVGKSKNSEAVFAPTKDSKNGKNVLIDANIKFDSAISDVLRNILKEKQESKKSSAHESLISDRESQDQMDPELLRIRLHDRSQ